MRIWVAATCRRKGIATKMLDSVQENFALTELDKQKVAFSSPTSEGAKLATKWFARSDFLVYINE